MLLPCKSIAFTSQYHSFYAHFPSLSLSYPHAFSVIFHNTLIINTFQIGENRVFAHGNTRAPEFMLINCRIVQKAEISMVFESGFVVTESGNGKHKKEMERRPNRKCKAEKKTKQEITLISLDILT